MQFANPELADVEGLEWLVTNGIGGYAMSTVAGLHTRRYHGLLVAALNPPTDRRVLVNKMVLSVRQNDGSPLELDTNEFPDAIHPNGYAHLQYFWRQPLPTQLWKVEDKRITVTTWMRHGSNTTYLRYANLSEEEIQIRLMPLLNNRDYHHLSHEDHLKLRVAQQDNRLEITSPDGPTYYIGHSKGQFVRDTAFHLDFVYGIESYRGLDDQEDLFRPGFIYAKLPAGESLYLTLTTEAERLADDPEAAYQDELKRLQGFNEPLGQSSWANDLRRAADQFIVERKQTDSYSILAGYPWFTDWGRDAMIALPGLCLVPDRPLVAKSILRTFLAYTSEGMIPNRFPDTADQELEYNTVDATLWVFVTLWRYEAVYDDPEFIQECLAGFKVILEAHYAGTRYGIHVGEQGFLHAGADDQQLTWMDAKVGDDVVTPRRGCPVEIQALWYNALKIYIELQERYGQEDESAMLKRCKKTARLFDKHFAAEFLTDAGYLRDVVDPGNGTDDSIRPNQLFALSLPYPLLKKKAGKGIISVVTEHLLTPYGLRTLSPEDPAYQGTYGGDQHTRDHAYHQGTVWPFLLEAYAGAYLFAMGDNKKNRKHLRDLLNPLKAHFYQRDCLNGVSEIFDGEDAYDGRGCVQQAWSVAALLRVLELTAE